VRLVLLTRTILQTEAEAAMRPKPIRQTMRILSRKDLRILMIKVRGRRDNTMSVRMVIAAVSRIPILTTSIGKHTACGMEWPHMADTGLHAEKRTALVVTAITSDTNIIRYRNTLQYLSSCWSRKSMQAMLIFVKPIAHPEACWLKYRNISAGTWSSRDT